MGRGWEQATVKSITSKKFGKFAFVECEDGQEAFLPLGMVPEEYRPVSEGDVMTVKITTEAKKGPKVLKIAPKDLLDKIKD